MEKFICQTCGECLPMSLYDYRFDASDIDACTECGELLIEIERDLSAI